MRKKIIRITTSSGTLVGFLKNQLCFLDLHYQIICVASGEKGLKELEKKGLNVHEVKINRHISILSDIKSLISLTLFFIKEKPYIVHANTPKASLLSMAAA